MQIARGASPRPINNFITSDETGVNWIKIGDVSPNDKYITKTNEKITQEGASKSRLLHSGDFVLSNSMSFGRPYILKIDGCIHDGWIFMSGYEDSVTAGYLYEVLNSDFVQKYWRTKANNGGAMTNLNSDIVRATSIPVPSLEEQNRIVGILDAFTDSIENLKQQIAQRRKQYEHYRDQLLDLEGKEGVEMKTILDVCESNRGVRVIKKELKESGDFPVFQNSITPMGYYHKCNYKKPTTFVITAGAAGEVGFCDTPFWAADDCLCLTCSEKVLSKYVFYFLSKKNFYLKSKVRKGAIPRLSRKVVETLIIPIINTELQKVIIKQLDTFEASISNLEAQLAQRQKQYEYYRNQLLTFE